MPTLNWIGKDKVVNHHLEVPFHVLERQYSFDENGQHKEDNGSENMIIHGDNLLALKSLLPKYEGKIKCIYIDPPYNTGEENWKYNDNVNDPQIQKWLHQVVGKEGEDLSRHDKWLCMMYPRLKLLQRLLSVEGFIAVSINHFELSNLLQLMDEIFGTANRLAIAPWRSEPSGGKEKTALRTGHEYVIFYSKSNVPNLEKESKEIEGIILSDKFGSYVKGRELRKWGATSDRSDRPNMWFGIRTPNNEIVYPYKNDGTEGYWRWGRDHFIMKELLIDPEYAEWILCPYDEGVIVNGEKERWVPYEKIRTEAKEFGWNSWLDNKGTNAEGTAVIKSIFGSKVFDTPKPLSLVQWIISLSADKDSVILDSFAGSACTAHAVLNLNKADGGNRKFICIEMMDYADTITAERVKRVIKGYKAEADKEELIYDEELKPSNLKNAPQMLEDAKAAKKAAKESGEYDSVGNPKIVDNHLQVVGKVKATDEIVGTGGNFSYYELGEPFLIDDDLNDAVSIEKIREYIYYMETRQALPAVSSAEPMLLGVYHGAAYYFNYEKEASTTLNSAFLRTIQTKAEAYVIYADTCVLSESELQKYNITFKKIPRDIARL